MRPCKFAALACAAVSGSAMPVSALAADAPSAFTSIEGVRAVTNQLMIRLAPGVDQRALTKRGFTVLADAPALGMLVVRIPPNTSPDRAARELRAAGLADDVHMDYLVEPTQADDDPLVSSQWHLARIGAQAAWAFSVGVSEVTIAFIDSGVDVDHPDLQPLLVPGYNAPTQTPQASGGLVQDLNGHGTATAGAASAIGNNGLGGAGVGWAFNIMPIRATNQAGGGAFVSDIVNGATWALENGADVISISYAGVDQVFVDSFGAFAKDFHDALIVWGIDDAAQSYSFDHPNVIVVSGVDQFDQLAGFSSFGPGVDLAAPATGMLLAHSNGGYRTNSGNSYATPLVSAAAALARAINPDLSAQQIQDILLATAEDLGAPGEDDQFGAGLLDVEAVAVAAFESLGQPASFLDPIVGLDRLGDGIRAAYFTLDPATTSLPDFASLDGIEAPSVLMDLDLDSVSDGTFGGSALTGDVAAIFAGFFEAPADRVYTFTMHADDGARLSIGPNTVIDKDGLFDPSPESGSIGLSAGIHPLFIEFFSVGATSRLSVQVSSPTLSPGILDGQTLRFIPADADLNLDGVLDLIDFSMFLSAWSMGDPLADFNADGVINLSDISVYLAAWALGI